MKIKDSALNWCGGKGGTKHRKLLEKILEIIDRSECKVCVDVFGGSGIVSLNIKGKIVKYNDLSRDLHNFFEVLKDEKLNVKLLEKLNYTLYSEPQYYEYMSKIHGTKIEKKEIPNLERAVEFFVVVKQSVNGIGATQKSGFKRSTTKIRRYMGQAVSAWRTNVNKNLPEMIENFSNIEVYGDDFRRCIERFDSGDTIFYMDPPYVLETRAQKKIYEHELNDDDHRELVELLLKIKGQVILSGYDNFIYEKLEKNGWSKLVYEEGIQMGNEAGKEIIWTNIKEV
ncbi:MAG: DNA adenine methylase [Clostridium sp.]|uniref:DNA adenine methylase n=1 Tax=Clostridium sp. TaxID=1506 RepID=UPI003F32E8C8